eukprot:TRINITY_DN33714_c0_g1_i1.p1 TRINITY_DN33714_c0_g1~~TRINITY_DN33714_c0_g1_i1.p1  ORF type:complete len:292 (+),score=46.58 TRINITY_DN33714_c0_g1_i1:68-943(+)
MGDCSGIDTALVSCNAQETSCEGRGEGCAVQGEGCTFQGEGESQMQGQGEGESCEDASNVMTRRITYLRRRPMHPDRFFAFARRRFGPLSLDAASSCGPTPAVARFSPPARGGEGGQVAADVLAGCGCVWFIGSDDVRAEWRFEGDNADVGPHHMIRCGEPWPAEEADDQNPGAGDRKVDLSFHARLLDGADGVSWASWEALLAAELNECLITREEALALEAGETGMLSETCEWEEMRASHMALAPWVARWRPMLGIMHGLTSFVGNLPGVGRLQAFGKTLTSRMCSPPIA